jgi:hypothetical protein
MYAHDTSQDVSDKSVDVIESKLQEKFKLCAEWMLRNKLSINIQKTLCMLIGTTQRLLKCRNLNIDFNGVRIEFVKQAQLLGAYIDSSLSWDTHVEFVSKKIIRKLAVLKRVSYFMP